MPAQDQRPKHDPLEDDDEDLDDLDDVIADFAAPRPKPSAPPPPPEPDLDADLMEGMDALLRQLAGEDDGTPSASADDMQRAFDEVLSGSAGSGKDASGSKVKPDASFDEAIRRTMEQLKAGSSGGGAGAGGGAGGGDFEELLRKLGQDPNLDGLDGDDELGGLLDGMMGQLMTKEILEEPMAELESKYPAYLASPPDIPAAELEKYRQQHVLVKRILAQFRKPDYSDDKDGKEVARLVGEMQDLGGPPQEIMGDLPEGFDLGALGGDECTIM